MKTIVLSSILLLFAAACASSDGVIQNAFDCSPGQDLEIRATLDDPSRSGEQIGQYVFLVEVANNSHGELTVKSVRVDPDESARRVRGSLALERAQKEFNETIAEGTEHVFELPATSMGSAMQPLQNQVAPGPIEFVVTVVLTNGDSYRCPFAVGR
ncbi:MAG: hypothetical protein ABI779_23310 [Acidobacteriota bacterium]